MSVEGKEQQPRTSEGKKNYWKKTGDMANSLNPFGGFSQSKTAPKEDSTTPASHTQPPESNEPSRTISDTAASVGSSAMRGMKGGMMGVMGAAKYFNPMACDSDSDEDTAPGDERNLVDHPEKDEVLAKKQTALAVMMRNAKNKYVEKGLAGKITIQILYGVITSGEFCTVNKTDALESVDENELKQLGALNFKAISAMDAILANLSRRSKQYSGKDLRSDITLTQGVVFGVSVPFFMSLGFQTQIQFECTAASLVDYRRRKEKLRAFQKKLKQIPNAAVLIETAISGGFCIETAQRAVVATEGSSEEDVLRWAAANDKEYLVSDQMHSPV